MLRVSLRNLLAHKLRLLLTFLAVALGVAFMGGTLVLTDTIGRNFDDLFADVNEGTDTFVRGAERFEFDFGFSPRPSIDASLVDRIREVDGVAAVEAMVQRDARIIDPEGEPVGTTGFGPPTFGGNWGLVDELNPFVLTEGSEPPDAPDELVIDKRSADEAGYEVGDRVRVSTHRGVKAYRLVGIARFGTADSPGGATFALTTLEEAQARLLARDKVDAIAVVAEDGVSEREVTDRIAAALRDHADDLEILTGTEITESDQSDIREGTRFFTGFLLTFAIVALVVGSFVIYNSFSILVAQRTREMALLRAIGASRAQVVRAVLAEAVVVGLAASLAGWVLGLAVATGLKSFFDAVGVDVPAGGTVVRPGSTIAAITVGFVVTVVAAVVPAWRASRVSPLAALRDVAVDRGGRVRLRVAGAVVVGLLGLLSLFDGVSGDGGLQATGAGAFLVFLATIMFGPVFARPSVRVLGAPIASLKGVTGTLARENAARNPRRTAATASALLIGVGIITFVQVASSSTSASFDAAIGERVDGDYVVSAGQLAFGGLPPELAARLQETPGVDAAAGVRGVPTEIAGDDTFASGIDPQRGPELFDLGIEQGDAAALAEPGTVAVSAGTAEDEGWRIGDAVVAVFSETGRQRLRIVAVYGNDDLIGDYVLGHPTVERNVPDSTDLQVIVRLEDGADRARTQAAIERVVSAYPTGELLDLEEYKEEQASQFDPLLQLVSVLLAMTIVIALLGIANTLALSVFERTRELGLLRAVGATRGQIRAAIRWEAVIIAILGTAVGIVVGVFFGWSIVQALEDEGIRTFRVPVEDVLAVVAVAGVLATAAAIYPAWRAGRLDVLEAIYSE